MKRFQYQVGVYVDAETEAEAWEKLQPMLKAAHEVDAEHEEAAELVDVEELENQR